MSPANALMNLTKITLDSLL